MKFAVKTWLISSVFLASIICCHDAYAMSLKVAPLEYRTSLASGEQKTGFVDISNPTGQVFTIRPYVQAFRQIADDGSLQFYDDQAIIDGITIKTETFELKPRDAVRVFFTVDGRKLPRGDVYGALFFQTVSSSGGTGVAGTIRVGTLLSITNQSPGDRRAVVERLDLPLLSFNQIVNGSYAIKNVGDANSGFYPEVTVSTWPGNDTYQRRSGLVFGGRTRSNDLTVKLGYGIHRVNVAFGDSNKIQFVVVMATWHLVVFGLIVLIISGEFYRRRSRR